MTRCAEFTVTLFTFCRQLSEDRNELQIKCARNEEVVREHEDLKEKYKRLQSDHTQDRRDIDQVMALARNVNRSHADPHTESVSETVFGKQEDFVKQVRELVNNLEEVRIALKKQSKVQQQIEGALERSEWINGQNRKTIAELENSAFIRHLRFMRVATDI